jgi:hypothetical protein
MEANAVLRKPNLTIEKPDKQLKKGFSINPVMMDKREDLVRDFYENESTENTPKTSNATYQNPTQIIKELKTNQDSHQNTDTADKNFIYFSDLYKNQDISSKNRFLFLFRLDWLANQFLCGCSLRIGVQIISIVFLAASMAQFFNVFPHDDLRKTITAAIIFSVYFVAGYCFIYSSIYYNAEYAYVGLVIYTLILYYIVLDSMLYIFFVSFGILNPLGAMKSIMNFILLSVGLGILLLFHLYFLWVCYSYWIHLKHKNFELVKGNFYRTYQEYDILNNRNVEEVKN